MIIRIALFLALLSLFYFYCSEDNTARQLREPNDINLIDIPAEIFPDYMNWSDANTSANSDSMPYRLTSLRHWADDKSMSSGYSTQNN